MIRRLTLLCFAALISCSSLASDRFSRTHGAYTVVAPGTIRSLSKFHVSISLDTYHRSAGFNITLNVGNERSLVETVEVEPETTKLVEIQLPRLYSRFAHWTVRGFKGIISRDEGTLNVEWSNYTAYIQTDKAKYKPGEMVQFRLICIDLLTRPAKISEQVKVLVYDSSRNLIKEYSNVNLVQGVFKGDLQLSEYPVLGEWRIVATVDGRSVEEKTFDVARYTLPTFAVEIISKENVVLDDGMANITIKATYIHGGPVKGNLSFGIGAFSSQSRRLLREKQIDGATTISLDFKADFRLTISPNQRRSMYASKFNLQATVQDALTRQSSQQTLKLAFHNSPYKIKVASPTLFNPREPWNATVTVVDLENNPVEDAKNPVVIKVGDSNHSEYLNGNGVAVFRFNLSDRTSDNDVWLTATYLNCESDTKVVQQRKGIFNLDILTESPEVGKELVIQLNSWEAIDYFVYEIVARGDIVNSDRIKVPKGETTYLLRMNVTHVMFPKITIFVHRVKGNTFDSRLKDVLIKGSFENSIGIDVDQDAAPGALVSMNVTTTGGSYVGLSGVDERLFINSDRQDDLTEQQVLFHLHDYDSVNLDDVDDPGNEAGLVTFSNAITRDGYTIGGYDDHIFGGPSGPKQFEKPRVELPRVRKLFSDSWMFKDFESTPKEGLHLHETVPDSITSWAITGFSLNPETGISLTKNATKLKVFQSFFISMDLPSLVKEGEVIETPVYVFNYMDQDLVTDVTIESDSDNVEFVESTNAGSQASSNQTISKSVPAQGKVRLVFFIRPRRSGEHNVTVKAISPVASDALQKTLVVEFEGVPYSFSKTYLVHFLQEGNQEDEFSVDIPPTAIPGSESVQLSVVGDVFGPLVRSLHKLARVPYGNCEENMRYFVSNLLVLKYLKTFNHSNPSLETKTKLHLELGYQTQMVFKHLDGSFSLFDRTKERTGDLWVTAYVMWGLQQASQYIKVDPKVTDSGLEYLRRKQREDGGLSRGKGVEDDVTLTAFTLLAFMVTDKSQNRTKDAVSKGLKFLYETLDDLEEPAHAAMTKYALILGKHEKSEELLSSLKSRAGFTSKQMEWIKPDTLQGSLQMTAGSFMSLLESQATPVETLFPVVRALISSAAVDQTPVHLLALEAMIKIARDMDFGKKDLSIHFSDGLGKSGDLHVDSSNAQLQQTVELNKTSRKVRLETKGSGFAIVNIKYKYNLAQGTQPSPSIYTTNATIKESTDSIMVLEVCLAAPSSDSRSNLTVMEVNLQSGYEVSERTFNVVLEKNDHVKSIQVNDNAASVRAYIEGVDKDGTCIQLEALKSFRVLQAKPISFVVYDAYKEDFRFASLHQVDSVKENGGI